MKLPSTIRNRPMRGLQGAGPNAPRFGVPGAAWRLPSGQLLVEYALSACFTAPSLLARFPYTAPAVAADDPANPVSKSLRNLSDALSLSPGGPLEKRKAGRKGSLKPAGGGR
jgi:hypothetical protein